MLSLKSLTISTVSVAALVLAGAAYAGQSQMGEKVMLEPAQSDVAVPAEDAGTAMAEPTFEETSLEEAATSIEAEALETADAAVETAEDEATVTMDIVDTAMTAEGFSTLVAALEAADLVDTLKGDGPFTVFAPTDEAFAALPEGTVEDLLLPENKDKLAAILTYHVLPGAVMSGDLAGTMSVPSVQGEEIAIVVSDDGVTIDGAAVLAADIAATNGVIHVIDSVILPQEAGKSR